MIGTRYPYRILLASVAILGIVYLWVKVRCMVAK